MKVAIGTIEFTDKMRQAIWWFNNSHIDINPEGCPLATNKECRDHFVDYGKSEYENMEAALQDALDNDYDD